ncbi:phage baseplate assembly protein gpV [Natronocella acetinitrilica]|uniref:Phage baseplate assembly protein gpV n=1 Tax=Natronocella acetinitrilica TaxID=414046 RepID=A0AAE3G7E1_9GAMM|nr:phage baseplate assembly protein V [Natronocella acetinitrilica]MCP1676424.1 phage baseplate assembly protein gpV [Natronocella acetinitrilica]
MPVNIEEIQGITIPAAADHPAPSVHSTPFFPSWGASVDEHAERDRKALEGQRLYGVYSGIVIDNQSARQQAILRVALPSLAEAANHPLEVAARLAQFLAGSGRGAWFVPDVGDEVLIAFDAGDPGRPFIIGSLWNGKTAPPPAADTPHRHSITTHKGTLVIDDNPEQGSVTLALGDEQLSVVLREGHGVEIRNGDARVSVGNQQIEIDAVTEVTIKASTVRLSAGVVNVDAGMLKASGVIQADMIIASTVSAVTYTPGDGNIW